MEPLGNQRFAPPHLIMSQCFPFRSRPVDQKVALDFLVRHRVRGIFDLPIRNQSLRMECCDPASVAFQFFNLLI